MAVGLAERDIFKATAHFPKFHPVAGTDTFVRWLFDIAHLTLKDHPPLYKIYKSAVAWSLMYPDMSLIGRHLTGKDSGYAL